MTALQRDIYLRKARFVQSLGCTPNLLIVTPNEEMRLAEAKYKVGQEIFNMRIVVCDTIDEMTPALVLQ